MGQFIFPKLEIPKVKRTTVNLSAKRSTSFAPGTLVPIWYQPVLPNDRFKIKLTAGLESFPMVQPTQGTWKLSFDFFFCPNTSLYGWQDNDDRVSTETTLKHVLFTYKLFEDYELIQDDGVAVIENLHTGCAAGSLFNYLSYPAGYKGSMHLIGQEDVQRISVRYNSQSDLNGVTDPVPLRLSVESERVNAEPVFHYIDIVRHYYANPQENSLYYMSGGSTLQSTAKSVSLNDLDGIFKTLRMQPILLDLDGVWLARFMESGSAQSSFLMSYQLSSGHALGGLFLRPYSMDLNRGLMNIDTADFKSIVSTAGGSFSVETLWFQNRFQEVINLYDVTSGRFSDWVNTVWSVKMKGNIDKPIYLGSRSQIINSTNVISTAGTESDELGAQAGFAVGGMKRGRSITFNSDIYGYVICIASLVPHVNYSQGFNPHALKLRFLDMYQPRLANIGYQDVPAKELYALPNYMSFVGPAGDTSSITVNGSAYFEPYLETNHNEPVGRRIAWAEYMTDVDRTFGLFSDSESLSTWVLNRSYEFTKTQLLAFGEYSDGEFGSLQSVTHSPQFSTYIDPFAFNDLFADTKSNAQNFRLFCNFDVFVKRAIPKRVPPHM